MQADEVKALIESSIPDSQADIQIDGNHVVVSVVSTAFEALNAVKRQQLVYAGLQEAIASGVIHAVHITAKTPAEIQVAQS